MKKKQMHQVPAVTNAKIRNTRERIIQPMGKREAQEMGKVDNRAECTRSQKSDKEILLGNKKKKC